MYLTIVLKNRLGMEVYLYEVKLLLYKKKLPFSHSHYLYQTHPDIKMRGLRPTLSRFNNYKLDSLISKNTKVLDVGSNVGLFSLFIGNFSSSVKGIEINDELVYVSKILKSKLEITNVDFIQGDITSFDFMGETFDLILSFSIHRHLKIDLIEYVNIINKLLSPRGVLLLESHSDRTLEQFKNELHTIQGYNVIEFGITDDQSGDLRPFVKLLKL
jgi:SAM-dependent methyltransferase